MENGPMVSEVSICNQALTWLGANHITSLEDRDPGAIWMRNNYEHIRDAMLESRMWTFATARAKSVTVEMDEWESMYAHAQPTNWLSVFRVYSNISGPTPDKWCPDAGWRMEGRSVLSRNSTVYMWGIERVTDTGRFSPLFVQVLAARLAADACVPLTENRALQSDLWNLFSLKLGEAATRDGQQGSSEKVTSSSMINVRRYTGG